MTEAANTACVIEINDAGIAVADTQGLKFISPGYAVADGKQLHTGQAGFQRARLNPRLTYDRFWAQLDQQPLHRPVGDAHTHADLAYFHLQSIWQELGQPEREVVFAVPGDFGKPRLALLLGIAQALEIPIAGLIASPVAAAAAVNTNMPRVLLDAELHRLTATEISGGDNLRLGSQRVLAKQGIAGLYDSWAKMIAERFVQETRYDPLHQANAEQMLYDRIPQWLAEFSPQERAAFELQVGVRNHHVDVSAQELQQWAAAIYRPLIDAAESASDAVILLSPRVAQLPGLAQAISARSGAAPVALTSISVTDSILEHMPSVRSQADAPAFVTALPGPVSGAISVAAAASNTEQPASPAVHSGQSRSQQTPPTHVLHNWRAYTVTRTPLVLDAGEPQQLTSAETSGRTSIVRRGDTLVLQPGKRTTVEINGRPVSGDTPLSVGDSVAFPGSQVMHLIQLLDHDAPA